MKTRCLNSIIKLAVFLMTTYVNLFKPNLILIYPSVIDKRSFK